MPATASVVVPNSPATPVPGEAALNRRFRRFARAAGVIVTAIGVLVLTGWAFGIDALKGPIPGLISMKANTALGFVLMGGALFLLQSERVNRRTKLLIRAAAAGGVAIGALSLAQYVLGVDLGIDELLFDDPAGAAQTVHPGRLAPQTAVNFVLLGVALLLLDGGRRSVWVAQALGLVAALISLFALFGYAYGANRLSTIAAFSPIALHTALASFVLSAGVLATRPQCGFMQTAASVGPGGLLVRRIVPAALVFLPAMGWLRLKGELSGLYGAETGVALFAVALFAAMAAVAVGTARLLDRADARGAEADLEQRRLAALVESSHDAIISKTTDGTISTWNRGAEELYGYSAEEAIGRSIGMLIPEERAGEELEILRRVLGGERIEHYETQRCTKDDRTIDVSLTISPIVNAAGEVVAASVIARDIGERRRAEAREREAERAAAASRITRSETLLAESQQLGQIGSWEWDVAANAVTWSDETFRIHGRDRSDFVPSYEGWLELVHPDDRSQVSTAIEQGLASRAPYAFPCRVVLPDGELRTVHVRGQVVGAADGTVERAIGTVQDVTERIRVEAEKERLETRVRQSERLESVGQLAGGVAHDFNNLLAVILNYSAFITDELGDDHPVRADVEEIRRAAERAAALTQQLLVFSRRERINPVVLDLNAVVSDTERLLARTLGEDVELVTSFESELWPVEADTGQVEQVLVNLAVNARDAMPDGGRLTIETSNVKVDAELASMHDNLAPGRYARVSVADTGSGMSREVAEHVFEPFFTTKAKGDGTGLGLATVYGIVTQAGGHIELYSEPDVGTVFKVYLPAADSPPAEAPAASGPVPAGARGETVLVVEDEPAVRALTGRILSAAGYTVLEAECGVAGVETWQKHDGEIDLLLTDVVMPDLSGREVAERIAASNPEVPVIYMSGYTDDFVARRGVVDYGARLIEKPFNADQLLAALRDALDPRSALGSRS